jgi:hypothetical protein
VDDDEIALYSGFYEIPTRVDDFMNLLFRQQRYFMIFLFVMMLIELGFIHNAFTNEDENVELVRDNVLIFTILANENLSKRQARTTQKFV